MEKNTCPSVRLAILRRLPNEKSKSFWIQEGKLGRKYLSEKEEGSTFNPPYVVISNRKLTQSNEKMQGFTVFTAQKLDGEEEY